MPLLLLTPGPLTTAPAVRDAMRVHMGSRDPEFLALTARIRDRLLALAPEPEAFDAVPVQGSGTFAVEAMLGSFVLTGNEVGLGWDALQALPDAERQARANAARERLLLAGAHIVIDSVLDAPTAIAAVRAFYA